MKIRQASHAGSWYTQHGAQLNQMLTNWLTEANQHAAPEATMTSPISALIAPHAGYSYSGSTAAFAYKMINPDNYDRIFILGPSHHVYFRERCVLSECEAYETPLYNLRIDQEVYAQLKATQAFDSWSKRQDEDEHSLEMHLPFVAKMMETRKSDFTIVPICVGSLTSKSEAQYGRILAPYLLQPRTLFVVSSDFCHWGGRFSYQPFANDAETSKKIWQRIEQLDKEGMDLIEALDCNGFAEYLKRTHNTICGRHPIGVLLQMVQSLSSSDTASSGDINPTGQQRNWSFNFLRYRQSDQCVTAKDSSVSYAAGVLTSSPLSAANQAGAAL